MMTNWQGFAKQASKYNDSWYFIRVAQECGGRLQEVITRGSVGGGGGVFSKTAWEQKETSLAFFAFLGYKSFEDL